jgi:Secretion system C-terminal sorting domain
LHRRDYNVIAQILPNGNEALTAFSGVFQIGADIPYLHSTTIEADGYTPNIDFAQYLNHYHCATLPIFSEETSEMHNIFFGGIAQYTMEGTELVQDNEVPFVKTIARVTRDANGNLAEFKLPTEMPDWLGSGAEFIRVENLPIYENGVIKLDELEGDSILLGYIYGGIQSTAANIFWDNEGDLSVATHLVYKVYLNKESITQVPSLNKQSASSLLMQIYPNPNEGNFQVRIMLKEICDVTCTISDMEGKELVSTTFNQHESGEVIISQWLENLHLGGTYMVRVSTPYETAQQRVIVKP